MAGYKYPRLVEVVDELPMTATGKILKRELTEAQVPSPASRASATISARLRACSLARMSLTRLRTVLSLSTNRRAIDALSSPCAIRSSTSCSRG